MTTQQYSWGIAFSSIKKRILLGLFVFILLFWSIPKFVTYYTSAPLEMLAGILLGVLLYTPTLVFLYYMMKKREKLPHAMWFVPLSVILFFGPVVSQCNAFFKSLGIPEFIFVGFVEEIWKIMPLLLILIFIPSSVKSTKDGIFYGALGGFGFAVLEMAAYFALVYYPDTGWEGFFQNILGRSTFFGTGLHIIWSAFLGGAIVYGLKLPLRWQQVLIPLLGFILVVFTHSLQDKFGKILAFLPLAILEPLFMHWQVTEETLSHYIILMMMYGASVNLLLINIIILPLLIYMIRIDR